MDTLTYPLAATKTGDLQFDKGNQAIAVSRVRLLIDTKVGERVFIPPYGTYITPFNTSNAEFDETMINSQINLYCLEDIEVNCRVSVAYDSLTEELKYTLEFNDNGNT
jgi:hypothetical protein